MLNILLIGNGAREHIIADTLITSSQKPKLFSYMKSSNPGIMELSETTCIGDYSDLYKIKSYAKDKSIDFAFIGPEEPLSNGVVDELEKINIHSIGPKKDLARLETSKSFTRNLLEKYKIKASPKFKVFEELEGISEFIDEIDRVVIKPDGLTGGKGVLVQGEHFNTKDKVLYYCKSILKLHRRVIIEEKLEGEEFSLQSFTDGKDLFDCPPVQDHKRVFEGDTGPNTGGMGSYSCNDHLLPFLTKNDLKSAHDITAKVLSALSKETNSFYKGVMYGGFMLTKDGVRLLEYNARLGDPEAMNVLSIFDGDFVELCYSIIEGRLRYFDGRFRNLSTVCKYVVPNGYPDTPIKNQRIEIGEIPKNARLFYAGVETKPDGIYMTGSRAVAVLGVANELDNAEQIAEKGVSVVKGDVFHRRDIGTRKLIEKRVRHIEMVRRLKNENILSKYTLPTKKLDIF